MATRLSLIIALVATVFSGKSQDLNCGTITTSKDIEVLKRLEVVPNIRSRQADPIRIAISAHIVRTTEGAGGLTESELEAAIIDVNEIYQLTNMEFYLFGDINYIDNSDYFNFNSSDEGALTSAHDVENTINVYFFNSAVSGENAVCGYAYFPNSGIDHVIMVNQCTTNGSTFPHELGHYFALYHTHGKTNTGTTDELVDGSNCNSAGDDICDTAADPNLSGKVDESCVYTGDDIDENGDVFVPNPKNLMSYSQKHCRDEFSQGQADRIAAAYQEFKTYLNSKTYAASFKLDTREVCEGEALTFTNKSVGALSYNWTFEGGTPNTSNEENPTVTYNNLGTYDVSLTIITEGSEEDSKVIQDLVTVKNSVTSDLVNKAGGFENTELQETVINNDDGTTFEVSTSASTEGTNSVYMDFLNYASTGEVDYLIFSTLNTTELKSFTLDFDYAYAPYDDTYFDGLSVEYRDPCGDWSSVWEKFGDDLKTSDAQTSEFIPTSDQWIRESIVISIPEGQNVAEFAFKSINGYGNQLYIDNYNIRSSAEIFKIDEIVVVNTSCPDTEDGSIIISASGPGSFEYSVDGSTFISTNEITNLAIGDYEVSVRNETGSIEKETVNVHFKNSYPLKPSIFENNGDLSIILRNGENVRWYLNESLLQSEVEATITKAKRGAYVAEVYIGECAIVSEPFIVLAVDDIIAQLMLFPNPATEQLNIVLPIALQKEITSISIRDLTGKVLRTFDFTDSINVQDLNQGIYILDFEIARDNVSRRFLKR